MRRAGPISKKLLIAGFATLCAIELLAGFELYRRVKRNAQDSAYQQLSAIFALKLQQITSWREERLADAMFLAKAQFVARSLQQFLATTPPSSAGEQEILDWLGLMKKGDRYDAVIVFDADLRPRMSIPSSAAEPVEEVRALYDRATQTRTVVMSDLHLDSQVGAAAVDLLIPVYADPAQPLVRPIGSVLLRINAQRVLFPLIQSWPIPSDTAETLLVRLQGSDILFLNELRHIHGSSMKLRRPVGSSTLPAALAIAGTATTKTGIDYRGVPVVFIGGPVIGTPWVMVAKMDEAELYATMRRQTLLAVLVVGSVVIATFFVGSTLWERREVSLLARLSLQGTALEAVANSVVMTLPNGTVQWVNPAFTELTGYSFDEVFGKKLNILKSGKHDQPFYEQLWSTILAGRIWHGEMINRRKDGTLYIEEMTITPVRDATGRIAHFVGIKQNVTQRKETERALAHMRDELEEMVAQRTEELKKSVDELEHFSYSITHDMRAPLRAMNAYASMLEEKLGTMLPGEPQQFVANIKSAAVRLDNLIRDSLNYSKVLRSEMPMHSVDLGPLLRGILVTYPNLHAPGITIMIEFQSVEVRGNESALTQCFSNLLGNAVKFVKPGVQPLIRVAAEDRTSAKGTPCVRITVSDNGIGIPEESARQIFDMFTRLHGADEYPGTGIGLAIVAKVVRRMNGTFGVDSKEGAGSSFWIELEKGENDNGTPNDPAS